MNIFERTLGVQPSDGDNRPLMLRIEAEDGVWGLNYSQLLSLQRTGEKLSIAFSWHTVTVIGQKLDEVFESVAQQRLATIRPDPKGARLRTPNATVIESVSVVPVSKRKTD